MAEERIFPAFATALAVVLLAFLVLFILLGFPFAVACFLYGLAVTVIGIAVARLLGRAHVLLQIAAAALPAAVAALLLGFSPVARYIAMGCGVLTALSVERGIVSGDLVQSAVVRLISPMLALFVCGIGVWFKGLAGGDTHSALNLLLAVGGIWLLALLLLLNRYSLRQAARAQIQREIPAGSRRSNFAGTAIFLLLVLALAGLSAIPSAFSALASVLHRWLVALLNSLGGPPDAAPSAAPAPVATGQMQVPLDAGGPSLLAQIIYSLLTVVIGLAALFGIGYGLYRLFPRLWRDISGYFSRLFGGWHDDTPDYHDRAESLLSFRQALAQAGEGLNRFARRFRRKPRLEDFPTNGEKVRFLFREFLHSLAENGKQPAPCATPDELAQAAGKNGAAGFARTYNRTRYGGAEPDASEVSQARHFVQGK